MSVRASIEGMSLEQHYYYNRPERTNAHVLHGSFFLAAGS